MPEIKIANQDTLLQVKSTAETTESGVGALLARPMRYKFSHEMTPLPEDAMGWNIEPNAPVSFNQGSAAADSQSAYLFGSAPNDKDVYKFSPPTTWTKVTEHTVGMVDARAVYYDNAFYVMAGPGLGATLYKYTPATDAWTQLASPGSSVAGAAAAVVGTEIFVCGGLNMTSELNLKKYNLINDTWTNTSLPTSMRNPMCGVINDVLYVFSAYSANLIKYMRSTGAWTTGLAKGPYLNSNICAHGVLNGRLALVGGVIDQAWMYDPVANKWSAESFKPSFTSNVGFTIADIFYAVSGTACVSFMPLPMILGRQYLGSVKAGQTVFYKTYAANAAVRLEGADLPEGSSVALTDGDLFSQFTSNTGVLRGWVS